MKFFIINSFRTMVYVAYIAIILAGILMGIYQQGAAAYDLLGLEGPVARALEIGVGTLIGWISASLVCGLIVTLLDIRDDINDRLPDARRDD
ncbi:hypothetical protein [Henriciella mobilis]|uniref:Uncharacterized protein n=1 Tax=Henriciella mobilis TaxID=2305467 RepID=A0A399RAG5_9PROT|nr:hypothetical protein [Henriciella mobilis]RIJ14379.1 hypothetical protein D1231_16580 [Henriciella mobilis]RIJ19793.1 hypothetical protein D1227_15460 [Henriciella mobilis]RIJ28418.1 hypothetical protein D1223_13610 [Henriciella mobilis]